MGSETLHTIGGLSWDQGQKTPGGLSWDQGLETLQACCHGTRDERHYRSVVMGSGTIHTIGLLSGDQGQDTL
jgi:hypothetical protein